MKNFFLNTKNVYYLAVAGIIIFSFSFFSYNFDPLLNSDDALNVLMAHFYDPTSFYCWGQDRGGTFIPMLSQVFIKIFQTSALTAVSLSTYLIAILGFIGFSNLLKKKFHKILLALILFLPFHKFFCVLRFPIGMSYDLIAFATFLIVLYKNSTKKHLILILLILIFTAAIWVSDLAMVTIGILLSVLFIFHYIENQRFNFEKKIFIYSFLGLIFCFLFIKTGKRLASHIPNYLGINNLEEIKKSFLMLVDFWADALRFRINETFVSVYLWIFLIFFLIFLQFILRKKNLLTLLKNKWFVFFAADLVIIFSTFLVSAHVLKHNMGYWYFAATYISLSMLIFIALENMILTNFQTKILQGMLIFLILFGAGSQFFALKFIHPKSFTPQAELISEFKKLGEIGLIGDYWESYLLSCVDPDMTKATPHDQNYVRNSKIVDDIFQRKNIYLVKNRWLETFLDTIYQFSYPLVKDGLPMLVGGREICKYKKVKLQQTISLEKFKFDEKYLIFDSVLNRKILLFPKNCAECKTKSLISGPYISFAGIGEYSARFFLKFSNISADTFAVLDVFAEFGAVHLGQKKISKTEVFENKFQIIEVNFKTQRRHNDMELRISYDGNAEIYFSNAEIYEK